jgi:hypothetical protein
MPPLSRDGLWDHQFRAIADLDQSLAVSRPRALIHMTIGSGKTFTACNFIYGLIAHAGAGPDPGVCTLRLSRLAPLGRVPKDRALDYHDGAPRG